MLILGPRWENPSCRWPLAMDISLVAPGFAVGGLEDFYTAVVGAEAGAYVLAGDKGVIR